MDRTNIEEAFSFQEVTNTQAVSIAKINQLALDLASCILEVCPASADRSDALRKLRESVMTASQSITLNGLI